MVLQSLKYRAVFYGKLLHSDRSPCELPGRDGRMSIVRDEPFLACIARDRVSNESVRQRPEVRGAHPRTYTNSSLE